MDTGNGGKTSMVEKTVMKRRKHGVEMSMGTHKHGEREHGLGREHGDEVGTGHGESWSALSSAGLSGARRDGMCVERTGTPQGHRREA